MQVSPTFLISDIRALWHSALHAKSFCECILANRIASLVIQLITEK